ncbi:MAG: hypothetical protein FJY76_00300 [Candidatus Aenigmarchaeota archaeon]|nr:hypothetical protein [Candidatus Aenigmarchaeota archaeon]
MDNIVVIGMKAVLLGILLASVLLLQPAMAAISTGPSVSVALSSQSPYPAEPGKLVTIEVQAENTGNDEAVGKTIEIVPKAPFTLLPGEHVTKDITRIAPRSSYSIEYRLQVDPDAVTGTYEVDFRVYATGQSSIYFEYSVDVYVEGAPNLIIRNITTKPAVLEPGATAAILVEFENIGVGAARDVQLTLNSSSAYIKPVLAKGSVFAGTIAPRESRVSEFMVSIESAAEEKTYDAEIRSSYKNENGSTVSKTFSIGLPVRGSIRMDIIKMEPNYDSGTLRIEVANKGTAEAKSIEARLTVGGKLIGVDYISSLKANKKTTLEFPLVLSGQGSLSMEYIGPGVESNSESRDVSLSFAPQGGGDGTGVAIVIVIVVVVVGYYFWSRRRKKKRRGQ